MAINAGKILRKAVTWLLRIAGVILLLLLLFWGLLQTQWGKNIVKNEAVKYLSKKLKTRVAIAEIRVEWLTHLRLNGVYLEDQQNRKLLSLTELDVRYDLSNIFKKQLTIKDLSIRDITIHLFRDRKDSLFNFSFIPAAFSDTTTTPATNTSPFQLGLGTMSVSKLNFVMQDQYGGQDYQLSLNSFKTQIDSFNLEKLIIHAKYLNTDSVNCTVTLSQPYQQRPATQPQTTKTNSTFTLGLDTVYLGKTAFNFEDKQSHLAVKTNANILAGNRIFYNQEKMHVSVGVATLLDHTTQVKIDSKAVVAEKEQQPDSLKPAISKPFTFAVQSLLLDRNNIDFDDEAATAKGKKQIDFSHLGFKDIQLNVANIAYDGKIYSADISQLKLYEKSGFMLQQLRANARYSDTGISLAKLLLRTAQNQLEGNVEIAYKSIDQITTSPGTTKINALVSKSMLQLDELLYFQPDLAKNPSFRPLLGKKIYINTLVTGTLNQLNIPVLSVKESQTRLLASARVFNLPDIKKMLIDLKLAEFSGNRKELLSFLPPNTIADSMLHYIPQKFLLKGSFKGTMNDLYPDLQLITSAGNVGLKGALKSMADKKKAVYDINVNTSNLQLGKLMLDTMFGNITASLKLKGKGYDLPATNAVYDAKVAAATYNGYTYHDVHAKGNLNHNKLEVHLQSDDPNIEMTSDTYYNMSKHNGSFSTQTDIVNADLMKLGFMKDTLLIRGKLNADLPVLDTAQLNGNMLASALKLQYGNHRLLIDSIKMDAVYAADTQSIYLSSPFADISLKGKYSIRALPAAVKTIANRYLYTYSSDTAYTKTVTAELQASVHLPDSMLFLIPGLKSITPFSIKAAINTDSANLGFNTKINRIHYADYEIDSLFIGAINLPSNEKFKAINYVMKMNSLTSPSINLAQTAVSGHMKHGIIDGKLALMDEEGKPRYQLPYKIANDPLRPYLQVGDSLMINKKYWNVNKNNVIYLNADSLKGSNLQIASQSESISILADSTHSSGMPLNINFHQFKLKNIADILVSDTTLIEGLTNGAVSVQSLSPFSFTSNLMIDSLRLKQADAGNLAVVVNQQSDSNLVVAVALAGKGNDVSLNGTYNTDEKKVALKLDMKQFNLQTVAPFLSEYLGKMSGKLKGALTINGTLDEPEIRGSIKTDSAGVEYKAYGTNILLPAEEIVFDEDGIKFNQFTFLDSLGNKGAINGKLLTKNYRDYDLNLKLVTKKFLAIDKKQFPDQMIYGPVYVDALVNIGGNTNKMLIDGSVKVIDKSAFTYIYRATETSSRGDGLIEFFDPAHSADTLMVKAKKKKAAGGMQFDLNMYIDVTPASSVTIVLDELSGDQLKIKGTAALNFTMSPAGQMSLTGNYIAESGDYDLSIAQLIHKKFSLKKGSTITWSGDPLNADMDITALYNVKTSAGELVNDLQSIPGIDKQKLNFEVQLLLTKKLLKPDINFKLEMPENEQQVFNGAIYTRIKQVNSIPSELNKQVMGLLAINRFIADNPFSSMSGGGGGKFETSAYITAGKLLTAELSKVVDDAIKAVDIDIALNVNEDYTSGTARRNTDLKVGLSRSLANNRLSVYVGSSFALEGQNQSADALAGLAGDVTLEYMLTKDGKYRIKAFRINENELSLQGQVVKTGVTFVVVLEFNKIRNVFKKQGNNK